MSAIKIQFVVITGLSGAGKSQAVKVLEDVGFFCVDNLPPILLPKFVELCVQSKEKMPRVAIVMDVRGGEFFESVFEALAFFRDHDLPFEVYYFEASDETLIKRFKETRRRHLLAGEGSIQAALKVERELLAEIRKRADHIIDTSELTPAQLREELLARVLAGVENEKMVIRIVSFGFKWGVPRDADFVFDCRFLPNPHYVDGLRASSGLDKVISDYVLNNEVTTQYLQLINQLIEFAIPHSTKEGKPQLVIAIGCTGGRHRSVVLAEQLKLLLQEKTHRVVVEHRDIDRRG
ncbi:MAG: RNase adapter RapZ [bacterium]|nr:RNase adapter RapZ [bacterium]